MPAISESVSGNDSVAISGTASAGERTIGVKGVGDSVGVQGVGNSWHGVEGISNSTIGAAGVYGAGAGPGVWGTSRTWMGVYGETESTTGGAGVWGEHKSDGTGTVGKSGGGIGVFGGSATNEGVRAETSSPSAAALAAYSMNPDGTGAAVFARKHGTAGHAGFFEGNVWVSGELSVGKDILLANADCAEDFDIACSDAAEPGSVMVVGDNGELRECTAAYDKRVAGVISGAGGYKPGIVLDKQRSSGRRMPVALLGKVYCKVDATATPVEVGDLLTTSDHPGHAMKAADSGKAFGAVIGKALAPIRDGTGLIPILIALQ